MKITIISLAVLSVILIGCSGDGMVKYAEDIAGVRVEMSADPGSMSNGACRKIMKQAAGEMERLLSLLEAPDNIIDRINEGETVSAEGEMGLLLTALNEWQIAAGDLWNWPKLEILPDGQFRFDSPDPFPAVYKYGWAVDAAAAIMIQGNIQTAKIQCEGVYRFWGDTESAAADWEITLPEFDDEAPVYTILPPDGGLNIINHKKSDIVTSEPKIEYINHVSWAENALSACIAGNIAQHLPSRQAMKWFNRREDVGLLIRYPEGGDTSLETDRTLSDAVSILVP